MASWWKWFARPDAAVDVVSAETDHTPHTEQPTWNMGTAMYPLAPLMTLHQRRRSSDPGTARPPK